MPVSNCMERTQKVHPTVERCLQTPLANIEAKVTMLNGVVKDTDAVARMLQRSPELLVSNISTLQEKLTDIVVRLELNPLEPAHLSKVVGWAPSLLGRDTECVTRVLATLAEGLGGADHARDAVLKVPQVSHRLL